MPDQDPFAAYVQQPADDPFAAYAVPASTNPTQDDPLSRLGSEFWQRANPIEWAKGLYHAAQGANALDIIKADPAFLTQAKDEWDKGNHLIAARKVLSYLSMGLGHDLDAQANMWDRGDVASAAGAMAGTAASFMAPDAAGAVVGKVAPRLASAARLAPANPAAADAVAFARENGIPLDAATATGNTGVAAVQHLADKSLGGSVIADKALEAQAQGLATIGEQLKAKTGYGRLTPEQAGGQVRGAIDANVSKAADEATAAYDDLRAIEADPAHAREVEIAPKAGTPDAALGRRISGTPSYRFAPADATSDQLFDGVLHDARRNGFTGSASKLREAFDEHVKSAEGLADVMDEGNDVGSDSALLASIRSHGGLKPFDLDHMTGAPTVKARGEFRPLQELFQQQFGHRGAGSIFRNAGKAYDDMLDSMHAAGEFLDIEQPEQLAEKLNEIARRGPGIDSGTGDIQHMLRASGVEPGTAWWESTPANNRQMMPLPVDLAPAKSALRPLYDELAAQNSLTPFMGGSQKGNAFAALHRLMNGPDHAPLSTVDAALSEIKGFARVKPGKLRTPGQAAAAQAIQQLHDWVNVTAENAPGAIDALEQGRAATKTKYAAHDVLTSTGKTPQAAFRKLTSPSVDVAQLRAVAAQAPEQLPALGRAWLDRTLDRATANGAFEHRAAIANQWEALPADAKRLLFPNEGHVAELDRFFRLVRLTAKNSNPSGTAHVIAAGHGLSTIGAAATGAVNPLVAIGALVGPAAIAKFLHSTTGVRLLTEGLTLPPKVIAQTKWLERARKFAAAQGAAVLAPRPAPIPAGSGR